MEPWEISASRTRKELQKELRRVFRERERKIGEEMIFEKSKDKGFR